MSWLRNNLEKVIGVSAFFIMLLMIIINVFSRYLFGYSFSSTEEIAFIGFTYSVFFGVSVLYKKHALISIDVLVEKLPESLKTHVTILNFSLLTVLNLILAYLGAKLTLDAWIRPTSALRIPYTFIYLPAVIAFITMAFQSFFFLRETLKNRRSHQG